MTPLTRPDDVPPIRAFVLLERGRGLTTWRRRYEQRSVYDQTPYDYGAAESAGVRLTFSEDHPEGRFGSFLRRGVNRLAGFDLIHVLRHIRGVRTCDVVWTHSESEHLALGLLKGLRLRLPPVIAQSVWLADQWQTTNKPRRALYRWCLRHVELATTLSPVNAAILERVSGRTVHFVPYGVVTEPWVEATVPPEESQAIRVLALGNDMHRDWELVREMARSAGDELEIRILTRSVPASFAHGLSNLTVTAASSVVETGQHFAWADVVCLPLQENYHASGITVMLEAAAWSVPCIATDTGGLRAYFGPDEVRYLPVGTEPEGWVKAIAELHSSPATLEMVAAMRRRVVRDGYSGPGFAQRHVDMSRTVAN